jgi:hypothetical protein
MIARRELLAGGGALALAAALPARGRASGLFLYDARLPASRAAASRATAGTLLVDTGRDLVSLWHGGLRAEAAGVPLAGATGYADLVVAQGIAGDERRRLSARQVAPDLWAWTVE